MEELRYFAYRRKSSEQEERQVLSNDSQKRETEAKFPNLKIVGEFEESHSAFYPHNRPLFMEMMERIQKGEADGIVSWHPDRLSRNEIDAAQITYLIRTKVIKDLKFGSYYFDNSPEGVMMLQMSLSQSQYFSSKLGKDVKRGLKTKAQNGWLPAMAPAGYMHDPVAEKGDKKILNDPDRFDMIQKALYLVIQGEKPLNVLGTLNNAWMFRTRKMGKKNKTGGKPLSRSGWYNILNNPFYYGEYEYPVGSGNLYQGKHEPMITREESEIIQKRLGNKSRPRPQKNDFAYIGTMQCGECGSSITAEEKWQCRCSVCRTKFTSTHNTACIKCGIDISEMDHPIIRHYIHYHCTKKKREANCAQGAIDVVELEKQMDAFLATVNISKVFKDWALRELKKSNQREFEDRDMIVKNIQNTYNEVDQQIKTLLDMKLAGDITSDEYKDKKVELLQKKADIKEKMGDVDNRLESWMRTLEDTLDFSERARHQFKHGGKQIRRDLIMEIGSNLKLHNKIARFDSEKPFEIVISFKDAEPLADARFEPEEGTYTKPQLEAMFASNPLLLRGAYSVRTYFNTPQPNFYLPLLEQPPKSYFQTL